MEASATPTVGGVVGSSKGKHSVLRFDKVGDRGENNTVEVCDRGSIDGLIDLGIGGLDFSVHLFVGPGVVGLRPY